MGSNSPGTFSPERMDSKENHKSPQPNILWICTDQQRFDTLGCYGNQFVRTPNIDRLAENGTLFERCFSQSPVCTPSRASFLTGRYPRTTRTRQNGQSIPADEVLVTKLLADAGYTCGLSGKLHISACDPASRPTSERRIDDGYAEFHWSHNPTPIWPTNEYMHWLQERGVRYKRSPFRDSNHVKVSVEAEHHQTTWCAEKAVTFIEANAAFDRPWQFSVNVYDPHHPFDPPADYLERYLKKLQNIPLPNYEPGELENKPVFQQIDHKGAYGQTDYVFRRNEGGEKDDRTGSYPAGEMSDEDHRLVRAAYWAMIDLIDEQVGRMLDALEATDQLHNTLVIFMSDHGEMLGDHGIYLKGPYFYDPLVRVPLIASWPGVVRAGHRSEDLVELVDLAPTLLDAANLSQYPGMQGKSLWPLLTGRTSSDHHRADVYCEYYNAMPFHRDPPAHATMLRTERHKLVAVHSLGAGELYDLEWDPNERRNLWDDADYQSVKLALLERLCDRMARTVDPLPAREATY